LITAGDLDYLPTSGFCGSTCGAELAVEAFEVGPGDLLAPYRLRRRSTIPATCSSYAT